MSSIFHVYFTGTHRKFFHRNGQIKTRTEYDITFFYSKTAIENVFNDVEFFTDLPITVIFSKMMKFWEQLKYF